MGFRNARLQSFKYALSGIRELITSHTNFKIHLLAAILVNAAGFIFQISRGEWLVIWLCIGMVLVAEAINTALEETINLLHPARHPLAGKVKDIAAGAVLIASIVSLIIACVIFIPHLKSD